MVRVVDWALREQRISKIYSWAFISDYLSIDITIYYLAATNRQMTSRLLWHARQSLFEIFSY